MDNVDCIDTRRCATGLRRLRPVLGLALPVLVLALLNGCAHLPIREVTRYASAFQDVAAVTDELLGDYSQAIDTIAAQEAAASDRQSAYPIQFNPIEALTSEKPDPAVEGFQASLRAVEAYNNALLDLAQGAPDDRLLGHAAAITHLLETLGMGASPGGLPATEMIQTLLSLLAQAQNQKQFAAALAKGRPIVDLLLDGFVNATPDFYRVRVGIVGAAITEIEFKQESVLDELEQISRNYAPPAAGTELSLRRARVETEVAALRAAISPEAVGHPLPTGAQSYDENVQDRLEQQARVLRGLCDERRALAEGLAAYHGHLADYVRLLDETRRYFDALLKAIDSPSDSDAAVRAHDVNAKAASLRADIRESRGALALPATGPAKP